MNPFDIGEKESSDEKRERYGSRLEHYHENGEFVVYDPDQPKSAWVAIDNLHAMEVGRDA